jgi:hypothetical protein
MIVAWQFIARNQPDRDPSRRVRCDWLARGSDVLEVNKTWSLRSHRSLRDGSFIDQFQAINCLATFIQSLLDKRSPIKPQSEPNRARRS